MPLGNHIADLDGLLIGHATDLDLGSGVTAVIFAEPAVVSVAVLGGAPGGRELGLLAPEMTIERVDAVVLAGGSAFGLDAAAGVQAALREDGRGLKVAGATVPLVPAAILFDLANGGSKEWGRFPPYRDLGHAAARAARAAAGELGSIGAGTGASTATVKGGIGSASARTPSGHLVGAIAAVNAVGSATIGDGPHFWAAPYEHSAELGGLGWPATITPAETTLRFKGGTGRNTTIALVATDAVLTKAQAKRLALAAHDGLARALRPAHAPVDGDIVFAAATGYSGAPSDAFALTELCATAADVLARAIGRGVHAATALPFPGALPAWRDRFGG